MKKLLLWIKQNKIFVALLCIFLASIIGLITSMSLLVWNRYSHGVVPTDAQLQALIESGGVYDHVVIFGVDGAGGYFDEIDSPGFDKIYKGDLDASVTHEAIAQFPTDSAPNWGSMIHGVMCKKHGRDNDNTGYEPYTDTKYPSFFKVYAERHPETYMASVVNWPNINIGIIEDIAQVNKIHKDSDELVAEEAINQIKNYNPKILFMHFDSVDGAGHAYGRGSDQYVQAMKNVDSLIGNVYDACIEEGWGENTLFITIADHGHMLRGGHGTNSYHVSHVVFAVAGGKGNIINGKPGYTVVQDMASVVMYALGEKQPESWDSGVPKNVFKGL